jgi:hypothetical protein
MMQYWGVKHRPRWQHAYIDRINASVRRAVRNGEFTL